MDQTTRFFALRDGRSAQGNLGICQAVRVRAGAVTFAELNSGHERFPVRHKEIVDAMLARIASSLERRPGHRATLRKRGGEPREGADVAQAGKVWQLSPRSSISPSVRDPVHPVDDATRLARRIFRTLRTKELL